MFTDLWSRWLSRASQTSAGRRPCAAARRRFQPALEMLEDRIVPAVYTGPTEGWMSELPGNTLLSELSIPGTHDSMTFGLPSGNVAQTQSIDLATQLAAGIRFLDIRLGPYFDPTTGSLAQADFECFHGIINSGQSFDTNVLAVCENFLADHQNECIVMSIKNDYTGPGACPAINSRAFSIRSSRKANSIGIRARIFRRWTRHAARSS